MRVPVVVAMMLNSIVHGIMLVSVSFSMDMRITFGMSGVVLVLVRVGFSGLAAGEEQGGESEGGECAFHWVLVLGLLMLVVQLSVSSFTLMRFFQRTYHGRWCRLMMKYTSNAPAVAMANMLRPTATPTPAVHQTVAAVVRPLE